MEDNLQHTSLSLVLKKNGHFKSDDSEVLAPANKLYPDILSSIFLMTAESARWELKSYVPQFRMSALTEDMFSIVTSQLYDWNWVRERQRRAKLMPFEVHASGTFNTDPLPAPAQTIHEAFPDFLRVQSFHVTGNWELIQDLFTPYAHTPNPCIRHLSISLFDTPDVRFDPFKQFNGDMPNLETFKLRGYSLSDSIQFWQRSLRSLHIHSTTLDVLLQSTITKFTSHFCCPSLSGRTMDFHSIPLAWSNIADRPTPTKSW